MRVLLINDHIGFGGAEATLIELYQGLEARSHKAEIFILFIKQEGKLVHTRSKDDFWLAIYKFKPDIIHLNNITLNPEVANWSLEIGIPVMWVLHDYYIFCYPNRMMLNHQKRERCPIPCHYECGSQPLEWLINLSRSGKIAFFVENPYSQAMFAHHGIHAELVMCGADTDRFTFSTGERHGLFAGHADPHAWWKGFSYAEEVSRKLQLPLLWAMPPKMNIVQLLQAASVTLVPSVFEETFCKLAAEARAAGAVLVGFDVAGLRHQTPKGTGFLVPVGDAKALMEATQEALQVSDEFRQQTRVFIEQNFSHHKMVEDYIRIYEGLRRK